MLKLIAILSLACSSVLTLMGVGACPAGGGGTNPTLITDVTNSVFRVGDPTAVADAFTPNIGDLLLVFQFAASNSATFTSPTDTCGNTFTSVATNSTNGRSTLYTAIAACGSSDTITVNYGGTVSGVSEQVYVQDWRGVNATTPVAAASIGNVTTPGTGTDAVSSSLGTGSTVSGTQTNNDVAGGTITCTGNGDVLTAGTGYTVAAIHTVIGNCSVAGETKIFSSVVSGVSATFTTNIAGFDNFHTFAAVIQHP